jgi:hypothetical protein
MQWVVMGPNIASLRYHKFSHIANVISMTYFAFMLEMLFLSIYLESGIAVIAGKVVGDAYLMLASFVLAPSPRAVALIHAALESWTREPAARGFLQRLVDHTSECITVNDIELKAFEIECQTGRLAGLLEDTTGLLEDTNARTRHKYGQFRGCKSRLFGYHFGVSWLRVTTVVSSDSTGQGPDDYTQVFSIDEASPDVCARLEC